MPARRLARMAVLVATAMGLAQHGAASDAAAPVPELRERLTVREDQRRGPEPWSTDVDGRPLIVSGEYEIGVDFLRRTELGASLRRDRRALLGQSLDVEAFYSFGLALSLFAQVRVEMEEDLTTFAGDGVSELFVERGEMWLYSEGLFGLPIHLDLGRLDFQDERRWWWDEELDAIRLAWEAESWDMSVAIARELGPTRSDRSRVDPEQERVFRALGEFSWDWAPDHALEIFALHQRDHSPTERRGRVIRARREDESDARLSWLGVRATGGFALPTAGLVGYWLDAGSVRGKERLVHYQTLSKRRSRTVGLTRRDVRGWAVDGGVNWILPVRMEPRVFAAFAIGSGDATPERGADRSYRQSGIHTNEAGFGGVEHFARYGLLLAPELSNLRVWTLGAGVSLFRSSSLDLVYHRYRLREARSPVRTNWLEVELNGRSRDLGHGLDLVLALEEWDRFEVQIHAGAFRAGRALGSDHHRWSVGGSLRFRVGF